MFMSPNLEPPQGNFFSGKGGSKRERGREIKKERKKKEIKK